MNAVTCGHELLVPFRPRQCRRRSLDYFVNHAHGRANQFSQSCSRRSKLSVAQFSRPMSQIPHDVSDHMGDTETKSIHHCESISRTRDDKVNEYRQNVVGLVQDDELFRRLQEDMRKNHRSGCGSSHVVHKFVQRAREEERMRRKHSPSTEDLQTPRALAAEEAEVSKDEPQDRRQYFVKLHKSRSLPGRELFSGLANSFRASVAKFPTPPCA